MLKQKKRAAKGQLKEISSLICPKVLHFPLDAKGIHSLSPKLSVFDAWNTPIIATTDPIACEKQLQWLISQEMSAWLALRMTGTGVSVEGHSLSYHHSLRNTGNSMGQDGVRILVSSYQRRHPCTDRQSPTFLARRARVVQVVGTTPA